MKNIYITQIILILLINFHPRDVQSSFNRDWAFILLYSFSGVSIVISKKDKVDLEKEVNNKIDKRR